MIVAVSGGGDSVALLRILSELQARLPLTPVVAHFDHRLRPDSAADANWVRKLAGRLKLPVEVGVASTDPPAKGIEEWARRQRYAFLREVAEKHGARWIAVAHTADDQVETVLHHVVRGTGLAGLRGMPEVRKLGRSHCLLRPCLHLRRNVLRAVLIESNQESLSDSTNDDSRWTRSALRNELLPHLRERFNPRVDEALLSLSRHAGSVTKFLQHEVRRLLERAVIERSATRVHLNGRELADIDPVLLRELAVRLWIRQNWPRQGMTFRHWEAVARVLADRSRVPLQLPRWLVIERRGHLVVVEQREPDAR